MSYARRSTATVPVLFSALIVALAASARADIAPPDGCTGAEGSACMTAGPTYNMAGTCTTQTCVRTLPPATPGDPPLTTPYTCMKCKLKPDGGTGTKDDSGCAYAGGAVAPGGTGSGAVLLGLASVAVFARRRRRR
jgi:hypothetical protein